MHWMSGGDKAAIGFLQKLPLIIVWIWPLLNVHLKTCMTELIPFFFYSFIWCGDSSCFSFLIEIALERSTIKPKKNTDRPYRPFAAQRRRCWICLPSPFARWAKMKNKKTHNRTLQNDVQLQCPRMHGMRNRRCSRVKQKWLAIRSAKVHSTQYTTHRRL